MRKPIRSQKKYAVKYRRLRRAFLKKEIQLRDLKDDFLSLFEKMAQGVFMVDREGRITLFNAEAQRITGYRPQDVFQQHFRTLLNLDDLAEGFQFLHSILNGQCSPPMLFRIRKKDRSTTIVELNGTPYSLGGRVKGAIGFFRDIQERKREEEERRPQVEAFKELNGRLQAWSGEIRSLKQEVNELLQAMGREVKYPLE